MLSGLYGRAARFRRAWYGAHPDRVRRLGRPVVSVGNLAVGGSGKTPLVAAIATLLRDAGERPAILSRGYGRRRGADGVVTVSDGQRTLVPADQSGDEPWMLARALPGVVVLASPDRHLAGIVAERRFDCTVHLLDDGFQHLQLARDVNVLVMTKGDLDESLLPFGCMREPLEAAHAADALVVAGGADESAAVAAAVPVTPQFRLEVRQGQPRFMADRRTGPVERGPVVAVAGIARPQRFFDGLRVDGWDVVREMTFRDHHWFSRRDLAAIARAAVQSSAALVMTTEKDAARLDPSMVAGAPVPWAAVPLHASVEPASFASWLLERLETTRSGREAVA